MKLTDMAIIFQLIFICLLTVLHIKSTGIYAEQFNEIMYDNVMDGIVEDSLRAGYKTVDIEGKPVVELGEIIKCFQAETSLYEYASKYILIYTDDEGFYVWDSDKSIQWSRIQMYSAGTDTAHENKVQEIVMYVEDQYGISLNLPYNDGESFKNTIDDFALIAMSFNRNSEVRSFSGAKIHKNG